jgi:hypothetical protein
MNKQRIYYGYNYDESRVMFATITGEMCDGSKVYTECDANGAIINAAKQYARTTRHGAQIFIKL